MLAAQYARRDTARDLGSGLGGRWRLLKSAMRFARGRGTVPVLHEGFRPVPFDALEASPSVFPSDADETLTRYFRVKTQGLHFCGAAYYGVPFVEGCHRLLLMFPVVMWQARWLAAGDGRSEVSADDVAQALTTADHHFGYSAAFVGRALGRGVRMLARTGDVRRLVAWYGLSSEPER
jgi:lysine-N-methylase